MFRKVGLEPVLITDVVPLIVAGFLMLLVMAVLWVDLVGKICCKQRAKVKNFTYTVCYTGIDWLDRSSLQDWQTSQFDVCVNSQRYERKTRSTPWGAEYGGAYTDFLW